MPASFASCVVTYFSTSFDDLPAYGDWRQEFEATFACIRWLARTAPFGWPAQHTATIREHRAVRLR